MTDQNLPMSNKIAQPWSVIFVQPVFTAIFDYIICTRLYLILCQGLYLILYQPVPDPVSDPEPDPEPEPYLILNKTVADPVPDRYGLSLRHLYRIMYRHW